MKKIKCIQSNQHQAFTEGKIYEADDRLRFVVGNDADQESPWQLTGMNVKIDIGIVAKFEEVA